MGGQACVFYGAAEFSRDTDLAVLAGEENFNRLQAGLQELKAERIAVPPAEIDYLRRGFAIHFRCQHAEALGMRVDVMSVMRGVSKFEDLWERRVTLADSQGQTYDLLSLSDLVQAKKTQRAKDWPMLRRLLEADYLGKRAAATPERIDFWLQELRTPELLMELSGQKADAATKLLSQRPLLAFAIKNESSALARELELEEQREREADRIYWEPLKAELERLRHQR